MINISDYTQTIVGSKYNLGGNTPQTGMDCFSMIAHYLKKYDIIVPQSFSGVTLQNYPQLYRKFPDKAVRIAVKYLSTVLQNKKIGFESAGDILIAKVNETKSVILAVDVGNGYLITATISNGISVINKNYYTILKVFTNGH